MLKTILIRMKNTKVFLAVISGIAMILMNLNIIDIEMTTKIEDITNIILSIGVAIGIFTSPDIGNSDTDNN